ncbi:hypothetical protein [Aestuariivirga sp.]|uniref:hypothetical protein n=1 Tax=Aestuariivirga sp. TaxID=2650926 RepID=UPI00391D4C2A
MAIWIGGTPELLGVNCLALFHERAISCIVKKERSAKEGPMGNPPSFGSVTLGELRRAGELLEAGCTSCLNVDYLEPSALPFRDEEAVSALFRQLRCSVCGHEMGYSHPVGWWAAVDGPSIPM